MGDVSPYDLGTAQNPLPGLDPSDYAGYGSGGNLTDSTGLGLGGALTAGAGALGLGALLAQGPGSLPSQFGQATNNAIWQAGAGQREFGAGERLAAQGREALGMAQRGELTRPQAAALQNYSTDLQNRSNQMFAGMGRNVTMDTSAIGAQADIDAKVNAMAQEEIRSTIALGLGELQGGISEMGQGGQMISAADQTLIAAGEAQIKMDQQYSNNLASAFKAIGTMFGFAIGGPAGGAVGGAGGSMFGGLFGGQ